jgi:hypothetical protein
MRVGGEVVDGGDTVFHDNGAKLSVDGDDRGAALQLRGVKGSEALAKMGDGKHQSSPGGGVGGDGGSKNQ